MAARKSTAKDKDVVPVEVDQEHEVVEHDAPAPEGVEDAPAPATSNDLQAEQYERAKLDPEFAATYAIAVDEGDRGPAWEYRSPASPVRAGRGRPRR